jgi:hypothetical protein
MDDFAFMAQCMFSAPEMNSPVQINGATIYGSVQRAEESRVHQFLEDNEWRYASYEIFLPVYMSDGTPVVVQEQDEVFVPVAGMKGAIRQMDIPSTSTQKANIWLFVVCIPR